MNDNEKIVANENRESKESGEQQFEFITEKIKKRPINKKKVVLKLIVSIIAGILFGAAACCTFFLLYPYVQEKLLPEQTMKVTIPVPEEVTVEEPVEEFVPEEDGEETVDVDAENLTEDSGRQQDPDGEAQAVAAEDDKEDSEGAEGLDEATEEEPAEKPEDATQEDSPEEKVIVNHVVNTIEKELELDDYKALMRKMYAVADSVKKSVVKVSGVSAGSDWFNNQYENNNSASGVIVADNGKELLIVCTTSILDDADNYEITFPNGCTYQSVIKNSDPGTGLTVLAVELSAIDEVTMNHIEKATFGSVGSATIGSPVLAVGSVYGIDDSVAMGQITSNSMIADMSDSNARLIATDIYGSDMASGVIANLSGRILGFICHDSMAANMSNLISAYSISDLNGKIEKISNGQSLARFGIIGTDVTNQAMEDYGVPKGAYVKEVVIDSPAMETGIRSGDVVVKIGTTDIGSFGEYKEAMLKCQPQDVVVVTIERPIKGSYSEISYEVVLDALQ